MRIRFRRLREADGLGLVIDWGSELVIIALPFFCFLVTVERPGQCKHCGHSPQSHTASRSHGFVRWHCTVDGCACKHFEPICQDD